MTVVVDLLRPLPRGRVSLKSTDPLDQPLINENFCAHPLDIVGLREGIRFADELVRRGEGMKQIVGADYPDLMPLNSDESMHDVILQRVTTGYREFSKPTVPSPFYMTGFCLSIANPGLRSVWNVSHGKRHLRGVGGWEPCVYTGCVSCVSSMHLSILLFRIVGLNRLSI